MNIETPLVPYKNAGYGQIGGPSPEAIRKAHNLPKDAQILKKEKTTASGRVDAYSVWVPYVPETTWFKGDGFGVHIDTGF